MQLVRYLIKGVHVNKKIMFNKLYMVSEPTLSLTRLPNMASTADAVIINSETHGNGDTHLIAFNASSQLPLKLTPSNFPSWRAQLMSLLIGYNL
jgi:hypothetical protein